MGFRLSSSSSRTNSNGVRGVVSITHFLHSTLPIQSSQKSHYKPWSIPTVAIPIINIIIIISTIKADHLSDFLIFSHTRQSYVASLHDGSAVKECIQLGRKQRIALNHQNRIWFSGCEHKEFPPNTRTSLLCTCWQSLRTRKASMRSCWSSSEAAQVICIIKIALFCPNWPVRWLTWMYQKHGSLTRWWRRVPWNFYVLSLLI